MLVKVLGNLCYAGTDYETGGFYDMEASTIEACAQNVLPFDKMDAEQKVLAKKATLKKPVKTEWIGKIDNKMIDGENAGKKRG